MNELNDNDNNNNNNNNNNNDIMYDWYLTNIKIVQLKLNVSASYSLT